MGEKMNVWMEKIFFHYILNNPEQFLKVEPYFFKNEDIQFVYNIVKNEYIISKSKTVPTPAQILALVRLNDTENKIPDNLVKMLLKLDNADLGDEEWIIQRFKAWKLSNITKNNILRSVELIRGLEEINYDNVVDVVSKIKQMFNESAIIDNDDEDLGDDFDDPEAHKIKENTKKIPTGWACIDKILSGGWDQASLNVFMGETNVGKSMWLQNISVKAADQGVNVVYVTLEMASQKCMKRMGSMRLRIPIKEYDNKAKDTIFMKNKINSLKNMNSGLFNQKPGKIIVKKYNTSECTVTDLDNYITKLEQSKGFKVNMLIVDYINIMSIERGLDIQNMLFLKGKRLAEGLRYIADKHNLCVVTATQTDKAVWGANDLELKNMPESKAVAETADSVWAIIRNPQMKKNNVYRLKILKLRDGEHKGEQIRFNFNTEFLLMENDEFVGIA